tara:strand:- start:456 stop:818 length:363 start_codon:yes stop_codon:yes gene_type:complete
MNMTMKEMMLQLNDRMSYIEEQLEYQHTALHSLTESCALIAESVKVFMDDFYGPSAAENSVASVRLPIAVEGDLLEKIKDPEFLKELSDRFKKETKSMSKLDEELEKIQDQIVKGEMGES